MCCYNNRREKWVISLVMLGALFSLAVAVPMILISYPGDECLLFVSVRGEALIYGHPAGCNFISVSHSLVAFSSVVFFIILLTCRRKGVTSEPSRSGSVKSLRGSVAGASAVSFGPRAKPTVALIIFSIIILMFVMITAIVILSGYMVTCGELQYETRRKLYGSLTLGTPVSSVFITCFSLFRDTDFQTRFHFDHYELSGSWHGQYTAYRHGRPHVWTGTHKPLLDIPTGLEMSLASCWFSSLIWMVITVLLILHRRSVKTRNREEIAESIEDARIWASDMGSRNQLPGQQAQSVHQYEMIKRNATPYESLSVTSVAMGQNHQLEAPPPPSDASDVETLLAHQNVIAHTHPEGSFFMTPEGHYVQLVNGVLTNVDFQPSPPASVQYSQLQFPQQNGPQHAVPSQSINYHQAQSMQSQPQSIGHIQPQSMGHIQPQNMGHIQPQSMGHSQPQTMGHTQSQSMGHIQPQTISQNQLNFQTGVPTQQNPLRMAPNHQNTYPMSQNQHNSQLPNQNQHSSLHPNQSPEGSVTSSQMSQAPTVSHLSQSSAASMQEEDRTHPNTQVDPPDNTRMNMRIQRDMANLAGIKCSQF